MNENNTQILSWKAQLRCRLSRTKAKRAWMVWAIWGMLGTSLTMEGTQGVLGLNGLSVAGLLTAPFWLAFILWPIFYVWRRLHDRPLWAEEVVLLLHDPESKEPFGLEIIQGRTGIKVAVEEVCQLDGVAPLLNDISKQLPDPKVGIPFETYDAKNLVQWGQRWLAQSHSEEGDVLKFVRWTDTLRYSMSNNK